MSMHIIFNNTSSEEFPIVITKIPPIQLPNRRYDSYETLGRDGNVTVDYGTYECFTHTVEFAICDNKIDTIRRIGTWLRGSGKLIISNEPDKYYKARVINSISFDRLFNNGFRRFIVQFECQPHAYECDEHSVVSSKSFSFYNYTNSNSKPIIIVKGNGLCTLTINNTEVHLDIDEYVELDCDLEEAYKGTNGKNNKMVGEFPELSVGDNAVTLSSQITEIKIIPRYRWL